MLDFVQNMARLRTRAAKGRHGGYIPRDPKFEKRQRERALAYRDRGHTQRQTAEAFDVCVNTIANWERLRRTNRSLTPQRHRSGRKRKCTAQDVARMRRWLITDPSLTDQAISDRLHGKITGRSVNNYVTEMGFMPKVPSRGNESLTPHVIAETRSYLHRIRRVPLKRRCYVDESKVYGSTLPSRLRTIHKQESINHCLHSR